MLGGLERMEKRHPQDRSHWYLFILGTEQAAQGRGLGSALLDQVLARVDADGMPAYLESSNERNLALYGRHGFEVTGEVAIPAARGSGRCGASPALEQVITEGPSGISAARWSAWPPGSTMAGRAVGRYKDRWLIDHPLTWDAAVDAVADLNAGISEDAGERRRPGAPARITGFGTALLR